MKKTLRLIITSIAITLILLTGLTTLTQRTIAQSGEDKAAAALPPEARQFDFWLGNWNVAVGSGGTTINQITAFGLGGGIAILENFAGGFGTSVSVYNTKEQQWYQTWFDQDQLLIEAKGVMENGRMVLVGPHMGTRDGSRFLGRLSWFNISGNQFDFLYELSGNGGQTWQPSAGGHNVRSATSVSASKNSPNSSSKSLSPSVLPSQFRQFNFFRGKWEVITPDCPTSGVSTVTFFGQGGGIAVLEDYTCGEDYRNTSVSFYSTQTAKWHHTSLDTDGLLLELRGERQDGEITLEGEFTESETGLFLLGRTTFSNISDSAFDRKFEVSDDGGQTWTTRFDAHYQKATVFQPESFAAAKVKAKKIVLNWEDTSPGESRYEVLQWNGSEWAVVKTLNANATKAKIKKLQPATQYKFAVRACDSNRCSEQAEIDVTTP